MPDQGLAPWVSANDKPTTATATKPISGDAAERRLKGEVMQLPSRDRRRIKDLAQNDVRGMNEVLTPDVSTTWHTDMTIS
jgi:transcriptional coactivator HFI1/ADA1